MQNIIQSFTKGMNTDTDISVLAKGVYREARNLTFSSTDGGDVGALENVRGNYLITLVSNALSVNGDEVVGYVNVVEDIVFFTVDNSDNSSIWYYKVSTGDFILKYKDEDTVDGSTLGFSKIKKDRIVGVGKYENSNIKKAYWTDGINEVRFINLSKEYTTDGSPYISGSNQYLPVDSFSILPTVTSGTLKVTNESIVEGGNLKAGSIQYSFRVFNKNGAESNFSPATQILRLTSSTLNESSEFFGEDREEDANKSVEVFLEDLDTSFDYIRVYSIFYNSLKGIPSINLIHEGELSSSSFSIIDSGKSIEELPLEEFNSIGGRLFTAGALASKNNYLIVGNIKEDYFDLSYTSGGEEKELDCRAYRFSSGGTLPTTKSLLYSKDLNTKISLNTDGTWEVVTGSVEGTPAYSNWDIPATFDCVNLTNDLYSTWYGPSTPTSSFIYDKGLNIGGSGPVISYKVLNEDETEKIRMGGVPYYPSTTLLHSTFKINEVYRVGIVFYDKKMRPSFTKWIGDILIPYYKGVYDYHTLSYFSTCTTGAGGCSTESESKEYRSVTTLEFTVDYSAIPVELRNKIKGARIVQVEKGVKDSTVLAQGITLPFTSSVGGVGPDGGWVKIKDLNLASTENNCGPIKTSFTSFFSPSISIGELSTSFVNTKTLLTRYVERDDLKNVETKGITTDNSSFIFYDCEPILKEHSSSSVTTEFLIEKATSFGREEGAYPATSFEGTFEVIASGYIWNSPLLFENRVHNPILGGDQKEYFSPASVLLQLDKDSRNYTNDYLKVLDIVQDNFYTKYGGVSYEDRCLNTYIPISEYFKIEDGASNKVVALGDTFISTYEHMYQIYDPDFDDDDIEKFGRQGVCVNVLESKINYNFIKNRPTSYIRSRYATPPKMGIEEKKEVGVSKYPLVYPDSLGDLYSYNDAYSVPSFGLFPKYFTKPLLFEAEQSNGVLVIASEPKLNGEVIDNWTKFRYNNILEVDTSYGALNSLVTMDNQLFFWQDKAFGVLAVNDRVLLQKGAIGQLTLGAGGILERYDYISNNIGNRDKYNISLSENAVFWVYSGNNKIYMFNGKLKELSTSGAVNTYLQENSPIVDPLSIADFVANETLFVINDEVLVFDWLTQAFTSLYDFSPEWLIKRYDGNFASIPTTSKSTVWQHNAVKDDANNLVDRADFYGLGARHSFIHFVVNDKYPVIKVFDNIAWHSTSENEEGTILYDDTFDTFKFYTEYQNTGEWSIDWKRRERTFNARIPRDIVKFRQDANPNIHNGINLDPTQIFKRRMRDNLLHVELKYDNAAGNKFSFPYVIIGYRQSVR